MVVTSTPSRARTVAWRHRPFLARLGQSGVLMSAPRLVVGVEVAKAQLDSALRPTGARWAVANDDAGMATLVARLQAVPPTLLVLEATGGYQRAAWVGVAPLNRESGTLRGRRTIWGGRAPVRATLSMSTRVAVRYPPGSKRSANASGSRARRRRLP